MLMKQIEQRLYNLHEDHYKKEEQKEGVSLESLGLGPKKKVDTSSQPQTGAGSI